MTSFHAVVQIDHDAARVLQFDADDFALRKITVHQQHNAWHASDVCTELEFFSDICDSLEEVSMVLVAGAAMADLRRYVDQHRPTLRTRFIGWETVNRPTEGQLLALARRYFTANERVSVASIDGAIA